MWLGLEALIVLVVGCAAPSRRTAVLAVAVGWALQAIHFAVLGEHYDSTLWGVGLFLQVFLGAVAVGVAVLAHDLVGRLRRGSGTRSGR